MTEKKKSKLLSAIRESMSKSGGCCGSDGSCDCSSSEPQEKKENKK